MKRTVYIICSYSPRGRFIVDAGTGDNAQQLAQVAADYMQELTNAGYTLRGNQTGAQEPGTGPDVPPVVGVWFFSDPAGDWYNVELYAKAVTIE